ncbi:kinesin-like protein KIN-14E [Phragmites australis]|uniref:kinesin-like protein KIN-14E n=1 Tax=Phragmites australis TaxID=29695 RepID=UPI002D78BC7C|nr:kinesin-like protein KIN-14E [Phragmites australis]
MEGGETRCPGSDHMDFSWNADAERTADCASPDREEEEPAPALSPLEVAESMILVSGPRVVASGLTLGDCRSDDTVLFINAGGGAVEGWDPSVKVSGDSFFEGGDVIETNESITECGDCPSLYHSARYGSFSYKFDGLAPGDYFLDLHFAEILYTCGPKGISAFDVLVQDEKILSQLDVYAVVGGNRPLQVRDIRVTVEMNGAIMINFKGVKGSPMVCGICIRKAPPLAANSVTNGNILCNRCSADIDVSAIQTRTSKLISKYEKQIEELTSQCTMKSNECYMAWSSVDSTNLELGRLKIELHQKGTQMDSLEQALGRESDQLRNVSQKYENDKKLWAAAISNLERKIKAMKQEQALLSLEAHDCANSIPDLSKMIGAVQALVAQCEDLKLKYYEEMAKRKKLHNIVQETKGNIRVFCRCRPLSKDESSSGQKCVVEFEGANDGDIAIANPGTNKKTFKFDRVFTPKDDQAVVYADASPLVTSVLDGYNVCIFAYGQTGTGKTFTMEGTERNRGVNYRTLEELFKIAEERKETVTYNLSVSVLEVYNEQIRDLLATSPSSKKLEIKQDSEGSHHVPGIVEAKVENIKEVWDVLQAGSNARAVGSNNVNEHSSRSHCMLCIMVRAKNLMSGECTSSKLWLVDLAGSERLAKTDVQGERLKEAQNINRSLAALGDVISALATKSSHIPYRNSKLTHLLQDSLGGDSKALMFVQISPSDNDVSETLSSLNFASRVRRIELGPAKKQVDTAELQKTKQMLERAKHEARLKDDSLRKLEENFQNLETRAKGKEQLCKNLQEKVKELEGQLDSKTHSQMISEKQQRQLSGKLKEKEEMCTTLQQKIVELEYKLRQPHQSDSEVAVLKKTIKELELKLKEQEHQRSVVELKIKELEFKLKEQEHQGSVAELKIKELELKLKEQEHQRSVAEHKAREIGDELLETQRTESMLQNKLRELETNLQERTKLQDTNIMMLDSATSTRVSSTPGEAKVLASSREEAMSEKENRILRSSNSLNKQPVSDNSSLPEVAVNEKKRKGDARSASIGGEQENSLAAGQNAARKRSLPSEPRAKRKSTEPQAKNLGRSTASSRAAATTHKMAPSSRAPRQQPGGNKTRGWVR